MTKMGIHTINKSENSTEAFDYKKAAVSKVVEKTKEEIEEISVPIITSSIEIKGDNHIVLKYEIPRLGQINPDVVTFDVTITKGGPDIRLQINTGLNGLTLNKIYSSELHADELAKGFFSFIKRFMVGEGDTPGIIDKSLQNDALKNKIYSDANTAFVWLTEGVGNNVRIEKIASGLVEIDVDFLHKYAIGCKEKDGKIVLYSIYKGSNREKYFPVVGSDALSFANEFISRVLEDGSRLKAEVINDPAKKQDLIMKLMKVHYLAQKLPHYKE